MKKYHVSLTCIYDGYVEANSPIEAADILEAECPMDVDGLAHVVCEETGEEWDC